MKIQPKKTWLAALGLALAVSTVGGVAVGAGAGDWYAGGNATVVDPDHTTTTLKLYDASGVEVTSGSTTTPLAAFAAGGGPVRAGDTYASLFVHLPQSSTAPGAWPGVQATGTDQFSGAGAVSAPAALSGNPYVRTTADGYTLAEVAAALPNTESSASFAGVYELRLRTSSPTAGVSAEYAAAYVKVTGNRWALTSAPLLGDKSPPTTTPTTPVTAVATTVNVTWPATITYGAAASVKVTVTAASGAAKPTGAVRLASGSTTVGTATLSNGATTLTVPKAALTPGSWSLQVSYAGAANAFKASQAAAKTFTVAKVVPGKPTFKVTKKPTAKKAGAATVAVPTASELAAATGKAQVVLKKKGKKPVKVTATLKAGKATVKLPKLAKGTWVVTVTYGGDAVYGSAKSKTYQVKRK